jgi:hypothetical protein
VIEGKQRDSAALAGQFDKALHVSPFMGMDHRYEARAVIPAQTLSVHISSSRAGVTVFDATLALRRRALTRESMAAITLRYPLATVRVLALIYAHAAGLKLAGAPVHPTRSRHGHERLALTQAHVAPLETDQGRRLDRRGRE